MTAHDRIAVDIGGTFTDLVAIRGGDLELTKASTTPSNFADGVVDTIEKSTVDPAVAAQFVHGTTVVINAITEREGVETALITTAGFRDVLDITRANRPDMFNFQYAKPEPFVPRRYRWEVDERIDQAGTVLAPLDEGEVRDVVGAIRETGIETIAVAYLNAYTNPAHERRTREIVAEEYPDAYVTLAHELTREYREYERTNTAVLNAYVRPIAERYLTTLEDRLVAAGLSGSRFVMKSNAGTESFSAAKRAPVEMVESGPVGGVFGAARVGERVGEPNVLSFDMGGTTAKTSLVEDGEVTINTDYWLERTQHREGYPLKVPVVDIVEIGAGGGSIAWVDAGGSVNVGPESAGADPGPACYGRGGTRPTVTDANLVTGRLDPEYFLGGEMTLDVDLARKSLEPIADAFGVSPREAAHGVLRVVNSNMTNALKQVSLQRGYDPRDFALVASGGAGGLHAPALGRELGVEEILLPRAPGQFSAWGMLTADLRKDYVLTNVGPFDRAAAPDIDDRFATLESRAREAFVSEGVDSDQLLVERAADLRYAGQEHTVLTPVSTIDPGDAPQVTEETVATTIERYHDLHESNYNFRLDDPVEVVNLRLTATVPVEKPEVAPIQTGESVPAARKGTRLVDFGEEGAHRATVYERDRLPTGATFDGPAVIEEPACTTLVHPDQTLAVDEYGILHLD